jgi:hypothetical protein
MERRNTRDVQTVNRWFVAAACGLLGGLPLVYFLTSGNAVASPDKAIPHSWYDADLAGYRLPLATLGKPPAMIREADYYRLPETNLKTYPVYAPDAEPPGYLDRLKTLDPAPLVDVSTLKNESDWIAAGREVFYGRELPRFTGSEDNLALIRNPRVIAAYRLQTTKDGILLGLRYVVRQKGKVELGTDTCAMCHVQVRADGGVIEGAPNNHTPFGPLMGDLTRRYEQMSPALLEERRRKHMREDYRVPYLNDDPNLASADLPAAKIAELYERVPLGVYPRNNTSLLFPVKIANLIGVQDLRFFDRTGDARNRGIQDLMRYCGSIADVSDALTSYGDGPAAHLVLANMGLPAGVHRTPDPLLYALALYIDSLRPPSIPAANAEAAANGKRVFMHAACPGCHTPGLFTNNRLTLAEGFHPPEAVMKAYDVMPLSVGTDPGLALQTRKGTGFYRVPSLRMLSLNAAFLHDGSVGSLEELFDPGRLRDDFHSSNWAPSIPPHAVKGHRFGTDLSAPDRAALVAYLKTL